MHTCSHVHTHKHVCRCVHPHMYMCEHRDTCLYIQMYVYINICTDAHTLHMCNHAHSSLGTCTQTCVVHRLTYVCVYTNMHTCIPAHIQINTLTFMCTCKYTPTHTHSIIFTHIYLHTGTHIYSHMHACTNPTHTHTHTHTHTYSPAELQADREGHPPCPSVWKPRWPRAGRPGT